jgi:hypothetical protein
MEIFREILQETRKAVSDPKNWTPYYNLENSPYEPNPGDTGCIIQHIYWTAGKLKLRDYAPATCSKIQPLVPNGAIGRFNDTHSHQEVLELIDKTIALVSAPPPKRSTVKGLCESESRREPQLATT